MKHLLLFCLILFALALQAQPAADFTITDSDGQQHQLYNDYLNQGKTVVLKIFFTYCPPCNSIAPDVEVLYQDWGGGNGDVEFISLSNKPGDLNSAVTAYKNTHDNTFPGAGSDGGSVMAAQLYTSGTYGFFLGTPTFVVIAPDGTVNFDPRGPNSQATLDSVSVAIAATGALMPFVSYTGTGYANTTFGEGIYNVDISISNLSQLSPVTDSMGVYNFQSTLATSDTYELTAEKLEESYLNGVSTADIIFISRHILGIEPFTDPLKRIAADVDRNSKITTLDLIQLRKLILGIDIELEHQPPWIFINADYQFSNPTKPYDEVYNEHATKITIDFSQPYSLDFIGIKIGDVTENVDPQW